MVAEGQREGRRMGCEDCERTICWVDYVPLGTIAVTWTTRVPTMRVASWAIALFTSLQCVFGAVSVW